MGELKGKIDFVLLISATNANPNGDPLNGNQPRISIDGFGEISDVCIKRKIRNRSRTWDSVYLSSQTTALTIPIKV